MRAGVVGGEEEEEHHGEAAEAGPADEDSGDEADCDEEFGDGDYGSEEDGVGEDDVFEEWLHEGIAGVVDELADVGGHAAPDEPGAGEFVFGKDEKEQAYGYAQEGQRF